MPIVRGYAVESASSPFAPFDVPRREPREHDVEIAIDWCGICHSDIHQARDEWGGATYPMVPGHEIVGRVLRTGAAVTKLRAGDLAGVGCLVDSCRSCASCRRDLEQYCERTPAWTYNSTEMDRRTPTYGGYSKAIVVEERFALRIAPGQELAAVAPLLCAGITTWSPLRHWKVEKGSRVGVVGLGGLGHVAVKLAASLGAEVTLLSTSRAKERDARRLGAHEFALTTDDATFKRLAGRFDLLLDTVSAAHDLNKHLRMVRVDGAMVLVGVPPEPARIQAAALIGGRKTLAGSLIGGLAETQEMLDWCAAQRISADVEVIAMKDVGVAYERMVKGDVRYRFVIDLATL
jgi:uncharacterized zinc-type alcohol dehydrogenase-like protein